MKRGNKGGKEMKKNDRKEGKREEASKGTSAFEEKEGMDKRGSKN